MPALAAKATSHRQSGAARRARGGRAVPIRRSKPDGAAPAPRLRRQPGRARHDRHRAARDRACSRRTLRARLAHRAAGARRGLKRACARPTRGSASTAEVAPFFTDLPARIAAAHLVIVALRRLDRRRTRGRSAGRRSSCRCRGALDQDQAANANVLAERGRRDRAASRPTSRPERLAAEIAGALPPMPGGLPRWRPAAQDAPASLDAAERLADLVVARRRM